MAKKKRRPINLKKKTGQYMSMMSTKTKIGCVAVIMMAVVGAILASMWPVQLGTLYTDISNGKYGGLAQWMPAGLTFGAIYLMAECITIGRRVLLDCIIAHHESEVREKSIEKMLKMPGAYYIEKGKLSGEKIAELNQGVAGFSQLIKIVCNDVLATVFTAVFTLVQVVLHAPLTMALIMILYLALTIIISVFQIRSQNGIRESIIGQKNSLDGNICQSIGNIEMIRSMHSEDFEKYRLQPSIKKISKTERKHHCYMGSFDCLKQLCKICFQVAILGLSIVLISKGNMNSATVITICLLFQQLIKPIDELYRFMDETASSVIKTEALFKVLTSNEDDIFRMRENAAEPCNNTIELNHVVVTTPDGEKNLVRYEKIIIDASKITVLKGNSGCGKTTLVRCLNRYYPYISGSVMLFGKPLGDYNQETLSENVFYITQDAFFFAGTIRDNLAYGIKRKLTDDEMYEALIKSGLVDDELKKKADKEGLHGLEVLNLTVLEGAKDYSGGQKRRLALARAFLKTPKLYILDESTVGLDENKAKEVLDHIEAHAKKCNAGIIYISHNKEVVDRCDVVIELQNQLMQV